MRKRMITTLALTGVLLLLAGCGKQEEQIAYVTATPTVAAGTETPAPESEDSHTESTESASKTENPKESETATGEVPATTEPKTEPASPTVGVTATGTPTVAPNSASTKNATATPTPKSKAKATATPTAKPKAKATATPTTKPKAKATATPTPKASSSDSVYYYTLDISSLGAIPAPKIYNMSSYTTLYLGAGKNASCVPILISWDVAAYEKKLKSLIASDPELKGGDIVYSFELYYDNTDWNVIEQVTSGDATYYLADVFSNTAAPFYSYRYSPSTGFLQRAWDSSGIDSQYWEFGTFRAEKTGTCTITATGSLVITGTTKSGKQILGTDGYADVEKSASSSKLTFTVSDYISAIQNACKSALANLTSKYSTNDARAKACLEWILTTYPKQTGTYQYAYLGPFWKTGVLMDSEDDTLSIFKAYLSTLGITLKEQVNDKWWYMWQDWYYGTVTKRYDDGFWAEAIGGGALTDYIENYVTGKSIAFDDLLRTYFSK